MSAKTPYSGKSILIVTGRLAEPAMRRLLPDLESQFQLTIDLQIMPITVAALMSPAWIAKRLAIPERCDLILLPGYCTGDLTALSQVTQLPIEIGPRDLRRLPEFFGGKMQPVPLDDYSIQIVAEINHAPRLPVPQIIQQAIDLKADGADVIDIGCQPGMEWNEVGTVVRELVDLGMRVSIDSLNPQEIASAVRGGAELVLSVNSSNRQAAVDWGVEVVAIPDSPEDWMQVAETVEFLAANNVPLRIDPILEPIGCGFANSLSRYIQARKIWPEAEMLMGIGNLTELSDVDSSGVNFLLLGICQELGIRSVLTTQVINWARSSVKECDLARRLVHYAIQQKVPPKNLSDDLVCLRDGKLVPKTTNDIEVLCKNIRDNNYRIFNHEDKIHLLGSGQHWQDSDAFELFHQLMQTNPTNVDPAHAFYLGYEMCKATIAEQLGKNYEQDEALRWGHLTTDEVSHRRLKRGRRDNTTE